MRDYKELEVPANCTDEQLKLIMQYATDGRKFEIGLFWQRSLFFWGFIVVAFVAYANLHGANEETTRLIIACFGLISSVAWVLQNRGSKYWQDSWEKKIEVVEKRVTGTNLFQNKEPLKPGGWWGPARYSVSRLAIALSYFTVLVWICLLLAAFPASALPSWLT
jgi:hypothetical protein